mgnify:FL=1
MLTHINRNVKGRDTGKLMHKSFSEGVQGFHTNSYNPHSSTGIKHKEWERGYNSAYFSNLKHILKEDKKKETGTKCGS